MPVHLNNVTVNENYSLHTITHFHKIQLLIKGYQLGILPNLKKIFRKRQLKHNYLLTESYLLGQRIRQELVKSIKKSFPILVTERWARS